MVRRNKVGGVRTNASISIKLLRELVRHRPVTGGIVKQVHISPKHSDDQMEDILLAAQDIVPDGYLGCSKDQVAIHRSRGWSSTDESCSYSLNKHKRWKLSPVIKRCIQSAREDQSGRPESKTRIVMLDLAYSGSASAFSLRKPRCTGYYDSSIPSSHSEPMANKYSRFTDLRHREKCSSCNKQKSDKETCKTPLHNKRHRGGTQRPHLLEAQKWNSIAEKDFNHYQWWRYTYGPETGEHEVRYNVCQPVSPYSSGANHVKHTKKRWEYDHKYMHRREKPDNTRYRDWYEEEEEDGYDEECVPYDNSSCEENYRPAELPSIGDILHYLLTDQAKQNEQHFNQNLNSGSNNENHVAVSVSDKHPSYPKTVELNSPRCFGKGCAIYIEKPVTEEENLKKTVTETLNTDTVNVQPMKMPPDIECETVIVNISKDSISPKALIKAYGLGYKEGKSVARKFSLDLCQGGQEEVLVLFEVCSGGGSEEEEEECQGEEEEDYVRIVGSVPVRLQVKTAMSDHKDVLDLHQRLSGTLNRESQHYAIYTLRNVVHIIGQLFLTFQTQAETKSNSDYNIHQKDGLKSGAWEFLSSITKWDQEIFTIEESLKVLREEHLDSCKPPMQNKQQSLGVIEVEDEGYCCICYEDTPMVSGETPKAIALRDCGHCYCVTCWQHHLVARLQQGDNTLYCPGYECDTMVDDVTFLALLPYRMFKQYDTRRQNLKADVSPLWGTCKKHTCSKRSRVILPAGQKRWTPLAFHCDCGATWCLSCDEAAHWPATCQQAQIYRKLLKQRGDDGVNLPESVAYFVDIKKCPSCRYPIEKGFGCNHMACSRCQHQFCWECLDAWHQHVTNGYTCSRPKRGTTSLELENVRQHSLSQIFYSEGVKHHKAVREYRHTQIPLKAISLTRRWQKRKSSSPVHILGEVSSTWQDVESFLATVISITKQVHEFLEFCGVILAASTRKNKSPALMHLYGSLSFTISIIDQVLESLRQNPRDAVKKLRFCVKSCRETMEDMLRHLPHRLAKMNAALGKLDDGRLDVIQYK